jgi:hypothetical protein
MAELFFEIMLLLLLRSMVFMEGIPERSEAELRLLFGIMMLCRERVSSLASLVMYFKTRGIYKH